MNAWAKPWEGRDCICQCEYFAASVDFSSTLMDHYRLRAVDTLSQFETRGEKKNVEIKTYLSATRHVANHVNSDRKEETNRRKKERLLMSSAGRVR